MKSNGLESFFERIVIGLFLEGNRLAACIAPFAPDKETDVLYGGFTIREITVAAMSVNDMYRKPMCMMCAGYGYAEVALLLGISKWIAIRRIYKGHKLFMKALKENRINMESAVEGRGSADF